MQRGVFIVLEGADGSGKGTQFKLLAERLRAVGYEVSLFDFPQYERPSSHFIKSYLNGDYGPASNISPYTASMFYALDRFEAAPAIAEALEKGDVVLANRFVGSNMAHQGSKFTNIAERRGFFIWEDSLEFQLLGIPRPSLNLFLRIPAEVSYELISKKKARDYTSKTHDEHEGDINHLHQTVETYEQLCKLFPKDFRLVECVQKNKLLSIPIINDLIWETIKPLLPKPHHKPQSTVVRLDESAQASPHTPRNSQFREVRSMTSATEEKSLELKDVSYLLLRQIAQYAKLSDVDATKSQKVSYYRPSNLPSKLANHYEQVMQRTLASHKKISAKLGQSDSSSLVLPLACLHSGQSQASRGEWMALSARLSALRSKEAQDINQRLLGSLQKFYPELEDDNQLKKPVVDFYKKNAQLADDLSQNLSDADQTVWLMNATPRNELDLLADLLYEATDLPKSDIISRLDEHSYHQKSELFSSQLQSLSPFLSRVFDQVHYSWDLICDSYTILYLLRTNHLKNLQLQPATPRYGYDMPQDIESANLENEYLECFDASLDLYSQLQAGGFENESQYAVLMGHKTRCYVTTSLAKLIELTSLRPDTPKPVRLIINGMLETLQEIHPLIGEPLQLSMEKPPRQDQLAKQPASSGSSRRRHRRNRRPKSK